MEIDDDLAKLLAVKIKSEEKIVRAYEHIRFGVWICGLLAAGLIAVTGWVIGIEWRISHIDEFMKPRMNMPERMYQLEEADKRINEKLDKMATRQNRMFKEIFKMDPD